MKVTEQGAQNPIQVPKQNEPIKAARASQIKEHGQGKQHRAIPSKQNLALTRQGQVGTQT